MADTFRTVAIERVRPARRDEDTDRAATEEPLEIRLHGEPFSVIMRTPGHDRELVAGFLLAEQVIHSVRDLVTIDAGGEDDNVVRVTLSDVRLPDVRALLDGRRRVTQHSSCGLCGRQTIESLRVSAPALDATWALPADVVSALPSRLRRAQAVFDETGGIHAAGLFDRHGALLQSAEDVGRHSAVDKVLGRMLLDDALPLADHVLFVSGRTSFEIVQKALLAGIPIVAAVSAPSTLAVELARDAGITLIGFVRGETFNVYSHGRRIVSGTDDTGIADLNSQIDD